jgi:hypothetical protein
MVHYFPSNGRRHYGQVLHGGAAFRKHTLLPFGDCLYYLQATIPHRTRTSLHRCLQRHDSSMLPHAEGDKLARKKFRSYPIGYFHIDLAEVQTAEGKLYLHVAIDRTSKFDFVTGQKDREDFFIGFPRRPDRGCAIRDPHCPNLQRHPVHLPRYAEGPTARYMTHMFEESSMKASKFSEAQIAFVLKQAEDGWAGGLPEGGD